MGGHQDKRGRGNQTLWVDSFRPQHSHRSTEITTSCLDSRGHFPAGESCFMSGMTTCPSRFLKRISMAPSKATSAEAHPPPPLLVLPQDGGVLPDGCSHQATSEMIRNLEHIIILMPRWTPTWTPILCTGHSCMSMMNDDEEIKGQQMSLLTTS